MHFFNAIFVIFCASNIVAFTAVTQRKRPFLQGKNSINITPQPITEPSATTAPVSERVQRRLSRLSLPSNATSIRSDISDNFSCIDKSYGYYADVENDCQIFHVCLPVTYPNGREQQFRWSFICPEDTTFNQELFTCVRNDEMQFNCADSERFYELNRNIGLVKDEVEDVDRNDLDVASSLNRNNDQQESVTAKIAGYRKKLLTTTTTLPTSTVATTSSTTPISFPTYPSLKPKFSSTKRAYRTSTTPKRVSRRTTTTTVTSQPTTRTTTARTTTTESPFKTTTSVQPFETLTTNMNYLNSIEEVVATTLDNLFFTTDNPSVFNPNPPRSEIKYNELEKRTPTYSNFENFDTTENSLATTSQAPVGDYATIINQAVTRILPELLESNDQQEKLDAHNGRILDSEEAKVADDVVANIKQLQNIMSSKKASFPIGMRTMRGQWNQREKRFLFKGDTVRNRRKLFNTHNKH